MTADEVINLLSLCAAYDRRRVGEGDVHAWCDAAGRGRWTFDEAADAVKTHYGRSRVWLMPGDVTEIVRSRRAAVPRWDRATLGGAEPADRAHVTAVVAQVARDCGWVRQAELSESARVAVLAVRCGHCGSTAGEACTRPGRSGRVSCGPHPTRLAAADGDPVALAAQQV